MKAKFINEGTWALPPKDGFKYIQELEKFQEKIYPIFGDDEVHNGLDLAIQRMKQLMKVKNNASTYS